MSTRLEVERGVDVFLEHFGGHSRLSANEVAELGKVDERDLVGKGIEREFLSKLGGDLRLRSSNASVFLRSE